MKLVVQFVNAFTDEIFKGNSAAVVITTTELSEKLMQSIATENNLSETAFAVKQADERYHIRWFSPIKEIDFCGHATLATAFVLFNQGRNEGSSQEKLTFFADAVGEMAVINTTSGEIQMNFPNQLPKRVTSYPPALLSGLSIPPQEVYLNQQAYFVVFENEKDVIDVRQNKECLMQLAPFDVVVTAKSKQHDFISRYFWPANGGDEDPVTGSIHAGLAPLWALKLSKIGVSQSTFEAYQASKRGGKLTCHVKGDSVLVSGRAVQYLEGVIDVPNEQV
ncbi:PhzF family phenazine biosynthesis isomerase [uncultured Shewanella sp.]|uniref:PhzF family phenazine biosynthesis protein n=1 Tax=uncultured Shewanella sp. TaxID=173975 RepID=UPI002626F93C|nr:PhzF family phenazine biosynthesis isomerase [uncultured Shewanella sp.]